MGYVASIITSRLGYNKTDKFGVMSAKNSNENIHNDLFMLNMVNPLNNDICYKFDQYIQINQIIAPLMPSLKPLTLFPRLIRKEIGSNYSKILCVKLSFGMSAVSAWFQLKKMIKFKQEIFIFAMLKLYGSVQKNAIRQKKAFFYREKSTKTQKLREDFCGKNAKGIPKNYDWYVFKGKRYSEQARANNDHHFAFPLLYPGKLLFASFTSDAFAFKKHHGIIFQFRLKNNQKLNPEKEQFVCFSNKNHFISKDDVKATSCFFVDILKKNDSQRLTKVINTGHVTKDDIIFEHESWRTVVKFIAPSRIWNPERLHNTARSGLFFEHLKPENAALNGSGNYKQIENQTGKNKNGKTGRRINRDERRIPKGKLGPQQMYMKKAKGHNSHLRPKKPEQESDDT